MKRNFDGAVTDYDGKPLMELGADGKPHELTIKEVCIRALNNVAANEQAVAVDEQMKRFRLARRINRGGEVELTAEDITLLKTRIALMFAPVVTGFIVERLEEEQE